MQSWCGPAGGFKNPATYTLPTYQDRLRTSKLFDPQYNSSGDWDKICEWMENKQEKLHLLNWINTDFGDLSTLWKYFSDEQKQNVADQISLVIAAVMEQCYKEWKNSH
jgi:hypothetical protein